MLADVRNWATSEGWEVEESETTITEQYLQTYAAPVLTIRLPNGRVHVEPVARLVLGAEGRVDLFAWPSLVRVMLLRKGEIWIVRPEMGPSWPRPWGRDTFVELARLLVEEE